MSDDRNNTIKVILVGDTGTGKTNLITVAAGFQFNTNTLTTTSCSFIQKIVVKNKIEYKINLWDTIGQEKYRSLTKIFLKDSKIVIFVYDITNKVSFNSLQFWKKIIDEVLGPTPVFGVVGNKSDLYLKEDVKEQEAKEFAKLNGAKFKLCTAKNDPLSFIKFLEELCIETLKGNFSGGDSRNCSIKIDKKDVKHKKECGC